MYFLRTLQSLYNFDLTSIKNKYFYFHNFTSIGRNSNDINGTSTSYPVCFISYLIYILVALVMRKYTLNKQKVEEIQIALSNGVNT